MKHVCSVGLLLFSPLARAAEAVDPRIDQSPFDTLPDGTVVTQFTLHDHHGMMVASPMTGSCSMGSALAARAALLDTTQSPRQIFDHAGSGCTWLTSIIQTPPLNPAGQISLMNHGPFHSPERDFWSFSFHSDPGASTHSALVGSDVKFLAIANQCDGSGRAFANRSGKECAAVSPASCDD